MKGNHVVVHRKRGKIKRGINKCKTSVEMGEISVATEAIQ